MNDQNKWLRQAEVLKQEFDGHEPLWKEMQNCNVPKGEKRASGQMLAHMLSGRRKIRKPWLIDEIARIRYPQNDSKGREFADRLRDAIRDDDMAIGDFYHRADSFIQKLKISKLVYPPFTGGSLAETPAADGEYFMDFLMSRFKRFVGHQRHIIEKMDLATLLNGMTDGRKAGRVGISVLCSLDRLTLFRALLLPPRVGLNAVLLDEHDTHIPALQRFLAKPGSEQDPKWLPLVSKHEVGYTHLQGLGVKVGPHNLVDDLRPSQFIRKLVAYRHVVPFVVVDEMTALFIVRGIKYSKDKLITPRLVFPLATSSSVEMAKRELPEYMLSILTNRSDEQAFQYMKDALWQILQTDVELLATRYVRFYESLRRLVEDLPEACMLNLPDGTRLNNAKAVAQVAREWAEYTLRLKSVYCESYSEGALPWTPILRRAINLVAQTSRADATAAGGAGR